MNSYLNELSRLLANSLSAEEFNNVMQYYTEYFADAGIENQEEVIKELGTPEELAHKIIEDYNNRQEEVPPTPIVPTPQTTTRPRRKLAAGWIVLIVIGAILVSVPIVFTCIKKSVRNIQKVFDKITIVEQSYMKLDEFDSIVIDASIADVDIVTGDEFAIEYKLGENASINNNGSTLKIEDDSFTSIFASDAKNIYDTYIKIYVPEDEVIDVEMYVDIGNINIVDVEFDAVNIEADIGNVCIEADSDGGEIYVAADMGSVTFEGYLACDMEVEADMGKVNITSYYASSCYSYNIDTDMGKKIVSDKGGEEIDEEYDINIFADMGDVKLVFCDN